MKYLSIFYVSFLVFGYLANNQNETIAGVYYPVNSNPKILESLTLNTDGRFVWAKCGIPCLNVHPLEGDYQIEENQLLLFPKKDTASTKAIQSYPYLKQVKNTDESSQLKNTEHIHPNIRIRGSAQTETNNHMPYSQPFLNDFYDGKMDLKASYRISEEKGAIYLGTEKGDSMYVKRNKK